jgi:hypothetical protein
LKTLGWTPAFAGETNLRYRPFSSFRRKPESSGIEEEFDIYTITALLVTNEEGDIPRQINPPVTKNYYKEPGWAA